MFYRQKLLERLYKLFCIYCFGPSLLPLTYTKQLNKNTIYIYTQVCKNYTTGHQEFLLFLHKIFYFA